MSLWFSLETPETVTCPNCSHEITVSSESAELFSGNMTHNLTDMAEAANIYKCLWRPSENGIFRGEQAIEPLEKGLKLLRDHPARFKEYDAPNGWGIYEHFVPFVEECLNACKQHPKAIIRASI